MATERWRGRPVRCCSRLYSDLLPCNTRAVNRTVSFSRHGIIQVRKLQARRSVRTVRFLASGALASMAMRSAALLCRLVLAFYITHRLGLQAMALYGFTIAAAAIMTAVSGFGISWRMTRLITTEHTMLTVSRVRDRIVQRLIVQTPMLACGACFAAVSGQGSATLVAAAAVVVMLEPIVVDLHQALVYRHRSVAGNFVLFLRSGSWIPVVVGLGLREARWRTSEVVLIGWAMGLIIAIGFVMMLALCNPAARAGLRRCLDWRWIIASGTSSPIVFASELGAAGLLYSDRFIVALFLGDRAAGVFAFIWSIINAVVPIVQGGVFNQMTPQLSSFWHRRHWRNWLMAIDKSMRHATWMSAGFGAGAMVAVLVLLRTTSLPLSTENVAFAALMTIATVLRMRADVLHHALYSAEQDSDWIAVNILGLILGPAMALLGIGLFGFVGAGAQMVVVAYALYTMRFRLMQRTVRQADRQARVGLAGLSPAKSA